MTSDVKKVFDKHLPKKELSVLSYDNTNSVCVVNSSVKWFDFDSSETGPSRLCTLDSVEIIDSKLIFAEFKNEPIKSGQKLRALRLKATESIMSLHKLMKKDHSLIKIEDVQELHKECYFVFSKSKTTPMALLAFNTTHRELRSYYQNSIYKKFDFLDNESFIRKFSL